MIIIQTTVDNDNNAKELINLLLETNKIACGTFHEIQTSYKWKDCLLYTSPSPRDATLSRMPSSA